MDNIILDNQALGQSTWIDYIQRSMLTTGQLGDLVHRGVTGLTSNPTIFEKAITSSTDYDAALTEMLGTSKTSLEIFEAIAIEDIQGAAAILRSVYDYTESKDGYACLEVPPALAHDTRSTVDEAIRLFETLRAPNVMIKVPATAAGIPAIRKLIGHGVNVNVTLIFSIATYEKVIDAYISGIEDLVANGKDPSRIASVASFFVSRIDTAVDTQLRQMGGDAAKLTGTAAIANARVAYATFRQAFASDRFEALREKGAQVQRPLWASTSTKDPSLPDTIYVDELIGPHTVNTMPPATLDAVLDHGTSANTLDGTEQQAKEQLAALERAGIDLDAVTDKLLVDGVAAFAKSFDDLISGVEAKRGELAQAS